MGELDYDGVYDIDRCNSCHNKHFRVENSILGSSRLKAVMIHCISCGAKGPKYVIRPEENARLAMNKAITLWNKRQ